MPETFNPFQQWLGLSPKIKNPHHFQLLGVSIKLSDPGEIRKAVQAGLRRNLDLLEKVPPGKHDALLGQIKQRISIAGKTLLDSKSRIAYVALLKDQIKAQKSGKQSTGSIKPASSNPQPPPSSKAENLEKTAVVPNPPVTATGTDPISPMGTPPDPQKPMQAIPLAVPLNVPPQDQSNGNAAPIPMIAAAIPPQQVTESNDSPVDDVKIDAKLKRKRKRSALGPILGVTMVIMAGVGGFLIYQHFDTLLKLGGVNPDAPAGPGVAENVEPKVNGPVGGKPDGNTDGNTDPPNNQKSQLPELDLDKLPELTESDLDKILRSNPDDPDRVDPKIDEPPMRVDDNPGDSASDKTVVRFDDAQLAKMRRHLQRAGRSLFRREKGQALDAIESAKDVLDEVRNSEDKVLAPEHQPVARLVTDTDDILNLIEGFWQQVATSCQSIPGGQEIMIGEQIVGFLEADQNQVTMRNAGVNITYQYYFCPPGLAMALATQGAIPDIPVWSKQLAALYAINQVDGVDHLDKIHELLRVAENAGHNCNGIRHFAEFQFGQIGKPQAKIDAVNKEELDEAVAEFRTESNYDNARKLTPGMAGMYAEFLMQIDSPNFEQHVAFLEEARQLAVQGGEASKVEDAILEMDIYANIDAADLTCKSFIELAKGKMTREQSRQLMERAISFLKSTFGKSADSSDRELLAAYLIKIAEANGMLDATRRLDQLN